MVTVIKSIIVVALIPLFLLSAKAAQATTMDPFSYYNVFSLENIGGGTGYRSDFQGTAGAVGNVTFNSFTLVGLDTANRFSLHSGGNVSITGGAHTGSIEAAGNVTLGSLSINGSVYSGGTVANSGGGTINGEVAAQNVALGQNMTVIGQKKSGTTYTPYADLGASEAYFLTFSHDAAAMGGTGATLTNSYGKLQTSLLFSGINVLSLSSAELNDAHTFVVNGVAGAILYINVAGGDVSLNSTTWTYSGGITAADVLVNYYEASKLTLSSRNDVNILAPLADTTFTSGLVTGNLIVGDLEGGGQVNLGHFDHGTPMIQSVPEPSTLTLLLAGGVSVFLGLRTRRGHS